MVSAIRELDLTLFFKLSRAVPLRSFPLPQKACCRRPFVFFHPFERRKTLERAE